MAVLNFFDILALRPNFFDDADIDARLDKEEIKMAILERCGTLLPVYTNSQMFKAFSDSFFKRRANIIKKLIDTTEFDYNPIHNYDRKETIIREYNDSGTNTGTVGSNGTRGGEDKVSAYDSDTYQPKEKRDETMSNNETRDLKDTRTGKETTTNNTSGNIGVTSTQKMINEERKVVLFDVYNWIAIEFEQHFFICVS